MFASIRRYRIQTGSMDELASRVDTDFAQQISFRPGFTSYEFVDCGDGEVMTISIFADGQGADASRELAHRWTEERLGDFEFTRMEPLRGEVLVSRADSDMLSPGHIGAAAPRFCSIRRYALRGGDIGDLMHVVDDSFAPRIEQMRGFEAYHALDRGGGELCTVSLFTDQAAAEDSDELALEFVKRELAGRFDLERTEVIAGAVLVSRAMAALLQPAHA